MAAGVALAILAGLALWAGYRHHAGRVSDEVILAAIRQNFDLTPAGIIKSLNLRRPVYFETARHGHFGRSGDGFTWEQATKAAALRRGETRWHHEPPSSWKWRRGLLFGEE